MSSMGTEYGRTSIILISNTDNKLTQQAWADYIRSVQEVIISGRYEILFQGFSAPQESWQNACWVLEMIDSVWVHRLRLDLSMVAKKYHQDNIALILGATEFITGRNNNVSKSQTQS